MRYVWSLALSLLVITTAASSAAAQSVAAEPPVLAPLSGLELYRQHYCGLCHALDRAGTAGIFGPTHDGFPATAEKRLADPQYAGDATSPEEYLRESILKPEIYIVAGFESSVHRMPAYTYLSEEEIDAIVMFLLGGGNTTG